jgi:hypothetical protein
MENLTTKQNLEGVLNHAQANINNSFSTIYSKDDVLNILKFISSNTKESSSGINEWFANGGMDKIKGMVANMMSDAVNSTTYSNHCTMDGYDNGGEYRVSIEIDESAIEDEIIANFDMDEFEEKLNNLLDVEEIQEVIQGQSNS